MISFIVPAYNEEALLATTMKAIRQSAETLNDRFEIIVVDDNSADNTAEIARACGVTVVHVNHRQIAATRNAGAMAAHGELLFFIDADTLVTPTLLAAACKAVVHGAIGGGAVFTFDGQIPLYGRIIQWVVKPLYRLGRVASGSFLFCTRTAFTHVGGFDESLYASEESAMSRALKRYGRFVILRETVITSGRKLRLHSRREILGVIGQVARTGGKITNRDTAHIWYEAKREIPTAQESSKNR
ncbi:MAG TPA: glycosyltransferase [Armatimonadota bacterium]|nr:glycosyltransferase [Armatimonadota bacterium]